jgi:hypothetical protein
MSPKPAWLHAEIEHTITPQNIAIAFFMTASTFYWKKYCRTVYLFAKKRPAGQYGRQEHFSIAKKLMCMTLA